VQPWQPGIFDIQITLARQPHDFAWNSGQNAPKNRMAETVTIARFQQVLFQGFV